MIGRMSPLRWKRDLTAQRWGSVVSTSLRGSICQHEGGLDEHR
jgi:hypothetical protein